MGSLTQTALLAEPARAGPRSAWRWVHVGVAALAMVATLPGRTHGLGLFTEPILRSLHLDRESYGFLNLWATLLGGLFCLPCGWLIDRLGTRAVLTGVTVALGATVIGMSQVQGVPPGVGGDATLPPGVGGDATLPPGVRVDATLPPGVRVDATLPPGVRVDATPGSVITPLRGVAVLFPLILLTRGLGQSALSVASLSLIGRSAGHRTGLAMGVYAFLTAGWFAAAFAILKQVVLRYPDDWRMTWAGIGVAVIAAGVVCGLLVRNRFLDADAAHSGPGEAGRWGLTLGQALGSPAFWTFGLSVSFFGLVSSGIALFNQSILAERGFGLEVFLNVVLLGTPVGLASNLLGGWLATRWPLPRLLALATAGLALALLAFPHVETEVQVYLYAAALAACGGVITVCFFTVWRRGFGPAHLGQVQGAAQMLTVLFSALGPQVFASGQARLGSYLPLFPWLAAVALGLALAAWLAPLPAGSSGKRQEDSP